MTNEYLDKNQMINIVRAHLRDLHAEKYSHELRIVEFDGAGIENIDDSLYSQISSMIPQYDLRIAALEAELARVSELPE
jgi:hypothetical protein